MTTTFNESVTLSSDVCIVCGIMFAMPLDYNKYLRAHGTDSFFCPNGHAMTYTEPEVERLRKQLASRTADLARAEGEVVVERNKRMAIERRIERGVCPRCHRTFPNLARHMKSKHGGKR